MCVQVVKQLELRRELLEELQSEVRNTDNGGELPLPWPLNVSPIPPSSHISDPGPEYAETGIDETDSNDAVLSEDLLKDSDNDSECEEIGCQDESKVEDEAAKTAEKPSSKSTSVRQQFTKLHGIFARHGVSLQAQRELLEFMRNLSPEVQEKLPVQGRSLRPPPIAFKRKLMPPGEFTYFGIETMLNYGG